VAIVNQVVGDQLVLGNLQYTGSLIPPGGGIARSGLITDTTQSYVLPWADFRKHDAYDVNSPGTPATSYLGLIGGTFGTGVPSLQTGDLKTAGSTTRNARIQFQLPPEYVTGTGIVIRLHAGMITHIADTAATAAVSVYKSGKEVLVSGSDLCTTSATTINSLVFADKDFAITGTSLVAGDQLDIKLSILVNDAAGGSSVVGCIGSAEVLMSIRG
jgi:hypothetical protein